MSIEAMIAVFDESQSHSTARVVLLVMANEADRHGYLTAYKRSQTFLAHRANTDVRTVRRSRECLVELGELQVLRQGTGRASSDYRILLPSLIEGGQSALPQMDTREDDMPALGGQSALPGGTKSRAPSSLSSPVSPIALARSLLNEWWERQTPRPQQKYVACVNIITQALKAGWTEDQMRDALATDPPVISAAALQIAAARSNGHSNGNGQHEAVVHGPGAWPTNEERW